MKTRTAILVICLAAISVSIGRAQTKFKDLKGKEWTCRNAPDGKIYESVGLYHIYDIQAGKAKHEAGHGNDHLPLCINALAVDEIVFSWPGQTKITATFTPVTDHISCKTLNPFEESPSDSKSSYLLPYGWANDDYSGCVYDVTFKSDLIKHDPHIIINGSNNLSLANVSQEELEADLSRVQKKLVYLQALEKKLIADIALKQQKK